MEDQTIKFKDGEYIVRPNGTGDTIIGITAFNVRTAMNKKFGYTAIIPADEKIKFIEGYKAQLK